MGLILIDSSVWIDRLKNTQTLQTAAFDRFLAEGRTIGMADLVLVEVLQGARDERKAAAVEALLESYQSVTVVDTTTSVAAARNYRFLRDKGITVRKTIDTLIATRCILDRIPLLYSDRDFDPFVAHLGLRSALDLPLGTN